MLTVIINPEISKHLNESEFRPTVLFLFAAGILDMSAEELEDVYSIVEDSANWQLISEILDEKSKLTKPLIVTKEKTKKPTSDGFKDKVYSPEFWRDFKKVYFKYKASAPAMYQYAGNYSKATILKKILDCKKENKDITIELILKGTEAYINDCYKSRRSAAAPHNWIWSTKSGHKSYYLLDWIERIDESPSNTDYTTLV